MKSKHWHELESLYQEALKREPAKRRAFLTEACAGDEKLLHEIASLLEVRTLKIEAQSIARDGSQSLVGRALSHYTITEKIGEGGMGEVYLAHDNVLGRRIAMKILPAYVASNPDRMRRFVEEAKAASALSHPNVATIHELGVADGVPFIAMEYVEGQTLSTHIAGRSLDLAQIVNIASQIAGALDAAHSNGITHRDIKPGNIMITLGGQVKVLDFGLAKRVLLEEAPNSVSTQASTEPGLLMGTVHYMSPEQALGHKVDTRTDLFSLGVVLYEMATGRLPFCGSTAIETINHIINTEPQSIGSLNAKIPPGLERIVMRCLAKSAEDRFQNARDLLNDLRKSEPDTQMFRRGISKSNLPQTLSRFIGRQREIAEVRRLLTETRLLTLSGSGGIGKTRLAIEMAASSVNEYSDGVWLVELASLSDAALVPQTVAAAIGVREERGRSLTDTLVEHLKRRILLLVLDNCEHLVAACAELADTVLRAAPNLRILATSREMLGITGEIVFRVPPLALPETERQPDVESLSRHEAVELFVDRAHAVKPTFALTSRNASALVDICIRLDGIPLAIELAASRVKVLSIEQIAARLMDRLGLLTGGSRTALPRHQTLTAAISWSYNLLSDAEQILFRRLSVFSGGWTLEAAETVCAGKGVDQSHVLQLLSGLVDKSLVLAEERQDQERYRLMATLLEYAQKGLMQTEEAETMRRLHAEFFVALAEDIEPKLKGYDQKIGLERLSAEYDNMRAALNWALEQDAETALRLAGALGTFWYLRGYLGEARKWLQEALDRNSTVAPTAQRAKALNEAGRIALNQGEYVSARTYGEQAAILSRELGDKRGIFAALTNLANVADRQGDYTTARSLLEESLVIGRELGDKHGIASSLNDLGTVAFRWDDYAAAHSLYKEGLEIRRELGDKDGIASSLNNLGLVASRQGDLAAAHSLYESLEILRELGDKHKIASVVNNLGVVVRRRGEYAAARLLFEEGLGICRGLGDRVGIAASLNNLGKVAFEQADYAAARSLFTESLGIRRQLGDKYGIALSFSTLGDVAKAQADHATARSLYEESLRMFRELGVKTDVAHSLNGLGDVARGQGDFATADSLHRESLALFRQLGATAEVPVTLENIAAAALAGGQNERAVRLWAAAQGLRERIAVRRPANKCSEYDRAIGIARTALEHDAFRAAWAQGQAMTPEQAIAYALQEEV